MKAMLLRELTGLTENSSPLQLAEIQEPHLDDCEILIQVSACGICHTELDEIEGRTPPPTLPVVLGHQVVGVIKEGEGVGKRVGVAWIFSACGQCRYCLAGNENLCEKFIATGRDVNGGYAEFMKVRADFSHPIPSALSDAEAAPLLCAGAVGYRAMRMANLNDGENLGLTGFGGSNHLVLKMVKHQYPHANIFVFTRNPEEREFAVSLGAIWAGTINETPPERLHAIIDATPAWRPIIETLKHLNPGGRMVINAIRKEEIDKDALLRLDYPTQIWMEKEIKSVANVTRQDVRDFLDLAAKTKIKPEFQEFPLKDANHALRELKQGKIRGAKVLRVA